ncbi:uncharacterized protein LOC112562118 [Pomacea canaliculata]|uniref:uncharacterized protein LOC112562118 n=1 Tax=Pomacea canaliculata TaxID=400727 RepID=UPI000D733361|nr:uncharacterized protein LOC112562118 [Pomacea canaliculata]
MVCTECENGWVASAENEGEDYRNNTPLIFTRQAILASNVNIQEEVGLSSLHRTNSSMFVSCLVVTGSCGEIPQAKFLQCAPSTSGVRATSITARQPAQVCQGPYADSCLGRQKISRQAGFPKAFTRMRHQLF